jgi:hypothetical protein
MGGSLEQSVKHYPYANIVGVEIDPLPLHAAKLITDGKITLISADVFSWAKERVKDNPSCNFYAIVGNPAYGNYQNLPRLKQLNIHNKEIHNYRTYLLRTLEEITIAKGVILDVAYIFKEWSGLSDLAHIQ